MHFVEAGAEPSLPPKGVQTQFADKWIHRYGGPLSLKEMPQNLWKNIPTYFKRSHCIKPLEYKLKLLGLELWKDHGILKAIILIYINIKEHYDI